MQNESYPTAANNFRRFNDIPAALDQNMFGYFPTRDSSFVGSLTVPQVRTDRQTTAGVKSPTDTARSDEHGVDMSTKGSMPIGGNDRISPISPQPTGLSTPPGRQRLHCATNGCSRPPSYGIIPAPSSGASVPRPQRWCSAHRPAGTPLLRCLRCLYPNCTARAAYTSRQVYTSRQPVTDREDTAPPPPPAVGGVSISPDFHPPAVLGNAVPAAFPSPGLGVGDSGIGGGGSSGGGGTRRRTGSPLLCRRHRDPALHVLARRLCTSPGCQVTSACEIARLCDRDAKSRNVEIARRAHKLPKAHAVQLSALKAKN
jgi:hypothetical protein